MRRQALCVVFVCQMGAAALALPADAEEAATPSPEATRNDLTAEYTIRYQLGSAGLSRRWLWPKRRSVRMMRGSPRCSTIWAAFTRLSGNAGQGPSVNDVLR